jgi:hypothetical protein
LVRSSTTGSEAGATLLLGYARCQQGRQERFGEDAMKVFVFDLLAYGEPLDPAASCPIRCRNVISGRTLFSHGNFTESHLQRQAGYATQSSTDYVRPEKLNAAEHARENFRDMTMADVAGMAERMPCGTPKEVTEKIIEITDGAGANMIQIGFNRGVLPQELLLEQTRRFGRDVLPALQAHEVTRVRPADEAA